MSMPPSGSDKCGMDEEAIIEAEIQFELDNINLDDDPFGDNGDVINDVMLHENNVLAHDSNVPDEVDEYIRRIQDQTSRFEQELLECDEILHQSEKQKESSAGLALIPYDDQQLLGKLAGELGCSVEEYKRRILEEIEQDNFEITDELAEFIDDTEVPATNIDPNNVKEGQLAITDGQTVVQDGAENVKLESDIEKAVQEGIIPSEVPVNQDMLPANKQLNGTTNGHVEIQQKLREQLEKLESRYEMRLEKIKKEDAFYKNEEEVRQKRLDEERLWKKQELEREEQKLKLDRELSERKIEEEKSQRENELREQIKQFEKQMADLQAETLREKQELERNMEIERQKQTDKQNKAAIMVQKIYRGYRVRKVNMSSLKEKKEVRLKEKEERRIKEVEQEIQARNEEKKRKEEEERLKKEEEKRKQEELKRQKELEKQQKEEEKRRKKEEEERKKQEEKQRKEEEKQRKKEEERQRKEEEKRRKEEEERIKKEEKRLKEEQERQKKEEEKLRKEEEKRKKEEEKRQIEEEKKRKIEGERKKKEEELAAKKLMEEKEKSEDDKQSEIVSNPIENMNGVVGENDGESSKEIRTSNMVNSVSEAEGSLKTNQVDPEKSHPNVITNESSKVDTSTEKCANDSHIVIESKNKLNKPETIAGDTTQEQTRTSIKLDSSAIKDSEMHSVHVRHTNRPDSSSDKKEMLEKLQQSGHIPHPPSPRKKSKSNLQSNTPEKSVSSPESTNIDCLPEQLESLRLKFMKECQPWSKVSNEPWKLKTGLSRKPLRRPSSAKKLPLLTDTVILQAARVASLQQVTTVQLSDLPGNNISPLGQCWGLKYLSMHNCNLVALDSLGQCKQLQYINVMNNKIEYIDLKDVGQLQYLNVSHNCLSSIHGVDNCSSLRWMDLSHNNITKLGGIDTLRRLNTLILSYNQLISAEGLGATPTLQTIDMSHNHLQEIDDLEKLCLLLSLDLSSNNLLKIPSLKNQVLLQDLNLSDNNISTLDDISTMWLPLLHTLNISQNSLDTLSSLHNCLTIKKLDISNNQISEFDTISKCIEGCLYLEHLVLEDNPVIADLDICLLQKLETFCPRLHIEGHTKNKEPIKPRTSFEMMCLTHSAVYKDIQNHFDATIKSLSAQDLALLCDTHHKYCEKLFNTSVEYRYAHEYGEVSVTMPTAPTTPKSGRPKSGRQKDTYASPKDMFENALKASNKPSVESKGPNLGANVAKLDSNPKDLFEQALKSAGNGDKNIQNQSTMDATMNGIDQRKQTAEEKRLKSIITIQAFCRGWLVRHEIAEHTKIWLAATAIQACWRGYSVRKQLKDPSSFHNVYRNMPPSVLEHMNNCATKIQAMWRGYNLRRKLLAALEYAQCNFDDDEIDEDAMMFGDDFDLDKFVSLDQNLLDEDWKPPETPDIPTHHAVLKKPPSGRTKIPPIPLNNMGPPNNPRRAWRNMESPLTDVDKTSRPPSSVASTDLTARTGVSRKEERLTEEWGFKDSNTAHLMMQRAKKMKYNSERRNKISKLDPKQRLALFRKLEEVTHPRTVPVPQRKTLPRKEYFKARQQEIYRQEQEKQEEYIVKASRTFEWLHTQVGDHVVSDSVINKGYVDGPCYVPQNFPELHGIKRVQLTSAGSLDLQSVDSVSSAGHKPRRASVGSNSSSKLPPIQTSSAPTQHVKERMSFRNPRVNQSVGWGGGKKRGSLL